MRHLLRETLRKGIKMTGCSPWIREKPIYTCLKQNYIKLLNTVTCTSHISVSKYSNVPRMKGPKFLHARSFLGKPLRCARQRPLRPHESQAIGRYWVFMDFHWHQNDLQSVDRSHVVSKTASNPLHQVDIPAKPMFPDSDLSPKWRVSH